MNAQDLVTTLKLQHRKLQETLKSASDNASSGRSGVAGQIFESLQQFKNALNEHLSLENGVFYPDYKNKKRDRGESLEGTEAFILQMDEIGIAVMKFLEKYDIMEAVEQKLPEFVVEVKTIIGTLNIRIETEEEGVYDFYLVMC